MKPFTYDRPSTLADTLALLARPGAKPLAGGTNLVDLMKLGVERPDLLVDVNHLGLGAVEETPSGGLRIGAGVRNSDLAAHPVVRERYPVLSQALLAGASGQLRNMASVGGNLLQRTRCVYFTDITKACNKREPGSGCPAISGLSRDLGILGTSNACIATAPGDMPVALSVLDAVVHLQTQEGAVSMPFEEFHRLPEDTPERDTNLPAGALVTAVELPAGDLATVSTYRKARDRASYAFALGSVAAAVRVRDGRVQDVRIAWGAVAHKPWRAHTAEQVLRGGPVTAEAFRAAADAELEQARPTPHNEFKVSLLRRLTVGALLQLTGGRP